MADTTERTSHGFTQEQLNFLREEYGRKVTQGFDRAMLMWLIGGLVAIGIAVSSILWAEIGSVRAELRDEIRENRTAISANRDAIAELAKGQARIEAILEERLPRGP